RSLVIAAERCDRLIEAPDSVPHQLRHLGDSGVGSLVEDIGLGDEVAREVEDVLRLERDDERRPQRVDELALAEVAAGLGLADEPSSGGVAPGPGREGFEALQGDRDLGAKEAGDVGLLGQEPSTGLHPTACQTAKVATASAAAAGIVTSHA